MKPCWSCGEVRVVTAYRAQGKNTHFVICLGCRKHTRDFTTAAAAEAAWDDEARAKAEKAMAAVAKRLAREAVKSLREDPAFVAAVAEHYVRYGRLPGMRRDCQIMHAPDPADGVDKEMNTAAFAALWLAPQWDVVERLVDKGGFVDHVLHDAGLGISYENGRRVRTGYDKGRWHPVKPAVGVPHHEKGAVAA